ncbi:DUF5765 domain-containing protein [Aliiruegeria sabulilitoris]|uniref:DUF5765 domain-containing protein n=1 Tax=Aliiruegeria sabulilitoris TaxID=1510458 RepID=UPI000836BF8F|nr:DUF5765 domain-containing protein [Aliiruegeria sabulilitoris]NDR58844.1 hypothetical protein [Pseudoruegeria sp. M32A2M]
MCWSMTASVAMAVSGAAAARYTRNKGEPLAIWGTLAYFSFIEVLQAVGYLVVDQCGDPTNQTITLLSYLHIALQPVVVNAFVMEIAPRPVEPVQRRLVFVVAAACSALLVLRLVPLETLGSCRLGEIMCGTGLCLASGSWHIAWEVPLNGLWNPISDLIGHQLQFPAYVTAVLLLPLSYGAWKFVLFHFLAGPVLAWQLTSDPNEMPAVWCLLSIGIIAIGISPWMRYRVMGAHHPETG